MNVMRKAIQSERIAHKRYTLAESYAQTDDEKKLFKTLAEEELKHEELLQNKMREIKKEIGEYRGKSICYAGLGNTYNDMGKFNKAIKFHKKSLRVSKKNSYTESKLGAYINIGICYHNLRKFNKAIEKYKNALKISKEIGTNQGNLNAILA